MELGKPCIYETEDGCLIKACSASGEAESCPCPAMRTEIPEGMDPLEMVPRKFVNVAGSLDRIIDSINKAPNDAAGRNLAIQSLFTLRDALEKTENQGKCYMRIEEDQEALVSLEAMKKIIAAHNQLQSLSLVQPEQQTEAPATEEQEQTAPTTHTLN